MSSGRNHSGSHLREMFIARHETLSQLHYGRFQAQRTRLQYDSDQTGVLTIEQQNLNERVLVVHCAFVKASGLLVTLKFLLDDYDRAQQNVQPQPRKRETALIVDQANPLDQITTLIAEIGVKIQNLEGRLRELEGIDVTDAQ